ncbi:MAG: Lrp/AsnC family transcriptional regulator [Candidatus Ranarchaeia archaeon]
MPVAFSLIRVESGTETEVLQELLKTPEVQFAFIVLGRYDIIVRVAAETMEGVRSILLNVIRKISHIQDTATFIAAEGQDKEYKRIDMMKRHE